MYVYNICIYERASKKMSKKNDIVDKLTFPEWKTTYYILSRFSKIDLWQMFSIVCIWDKGVDSLTPIFGLKNGQIIKHGLNIF